MEKLKTRGSATHAEGLQLSGEHGVRVVLEPGFAIGRPGVVAAGA